MKRTFTASLWQEGKWFVSQCNEIEIVSQGKSKEEALKNLKDAIELHFEKPKVTIFPKIYHIEAQVNVTL